MAFIAPVMGLPGRTVHGPTSRVHPARQLSTRRTGNHRCRWQASTTPDGSAGSPVPTETPLPSQSQDYDSSATPKRPQRAFSTFEWRSHNINYQATGVEDGDPVLIVHGFGASINHWRKNIPALAATDRLRVYTIDLLGFGASDKPSPRIASYSIDLWKELVIDFTTAIHPDRRWSFVGNSIGSLISIAAASELGESRVRACALMNCAGGLLSFRYSELNPLSAFIFWLFNTVLFNRFTGPSLFRRFRTPENVRGILAQVYMDQSAITDKLIDILCTPALDEGACEVFLAIFNADAGPTPEDILPQLTWCPMLVVWGEKDPWTPLRNGLHPGINFPNLHPGIDLKVIPDSGHCVHDERPELVNAELVPFLLNPVLKPAS